MSDDLTPYEQTYGAATGKQAPAERPAAPQPAAAPEPQPAAGAAAAQPATSAQPPAPDPATRVQAASQPSPAAPPAPPAAPAKRKAWPWVVLGCAVALLLLVGGCASCAVITTLAALDDYDDRHLYDHHDEYDHSFGGYDDDLDYLYDDWEDLLDEYGYGLTDLSFDDILILTDLDEGSYKGTSFGEGVYKVGDGGLEPGLYYLEGTQDGVAWYLTFDQTSSTGQRTYDIDDSVIYMGGYFTELEAGDVIAFMPPAGSRSKMRPASDEPLDVNPPYQSGCYRVGIDIPAGTYVITLEPEAAAALAQDDGEPGAYVMDDLEFEAGSVVKEAPVIAGSKQTVTVKEGQYLELLAATATPQG